MGKVIFTVVAIVLLNIMPLAGEPALMLHFKTIFLVIAAASLWLSQPAFSTRDTKENKTSDRSSILIILIMSSSSVVFSVLEWAYFSTDHSALNPIVYAGAILLIAGIAIRIYSIRTLGKHFTATAKINNDHELIKTGPYQFVRHPSYLGAFMAIIGMPLFLNDRWAILFVILAMSLAYYIRINVEEKMLSAFFGENYTQYKSNTKRIIPYIW
ncbi:MAG: isoprenylcysteine carboxylmethyltransferase family protein [Chitinophagaceae bacterium]|nr:isoprenylcysteine carboxylmethyltransferase family protein [Chitinophagaceae bacterium]